MVEGQTAAQESWLGISGLRQGCWQAYKMKGRVVEVQMQPRRARQAKKAQRR